MPKPGVTSSRPAFEERRGNEKERERERKREREREREKGEKERERPERQTETRTRRGVDIVATNVTAATVPKLGVTFDIVTRLKKREGKKDK